MAEGVPLSILKEGLAIIRTHLIELTSNIVVLGECLRNVIILCVDVWVVLKLHRFVYILCHFVQQFQFVVTMRRLLAHTLLASGEEVV